MKIDAKTLDVVVQAVQTEVQLVTRTLKEKGSKRFERPLIISAIVIVAAYYLVYLPPQRKLDGLQRRIDTAKATSENAEAFKAARDRLRAVYAILPKTKDKDHFLTQAIIETLRAEGLTSDSIKPPEEARDSDLVFQQMTVSAQLKFPELIGWLARLEASKPFLHVASVDLVKSKRLGYCEVTAAVSTIVPERDLTH
jgi:type II secretory pathway component PulM